MVLHSRAVLTTLFAGWLALLASCNPQADASGPRPVVNRPPSPQEPVPAQVVVVPRVDTLFGVGASVELGAVVVGAGGAVIAGVPVTWTSLAPGVALVGMDTGTVTAVGLGVATIRASAGPATGDAEVVVLEPGSS